MMQCANPKLSPTEDLPIGFSGAHLNIQVAADGRAWVCVDGKSIVRVKGLIRVTIDDPNGVVQKKSTGD